MTIVFQGDPGAFSEAVATDAVPGARVTGLPTFRQVFEAVATGEAERGVVPVENSVAGSVSAVLDGLLEHRVAIVGERWERVEHALLAAEGTALEDVREVRSQTQALAVCAAKLRARLPGVPLVEVADTAGAARQIAREKLKGVSALASERAAELYGLAVLARNVEGETANVTRFLVLASEGTSAEQTEAMKTTLVLTPRVAVPNAFFRSLTAFVGRRLRVWKAEPRARVGVPAAYRYVVDVEGAVGTDAFDAALADLGALNDEVRVLGSYPAGSIPDVG